MNKAYRTRIAGFLFLLAVAMLLSVPAFAQPARPQNPPDISGEWRLESNEDPGQLGALGQPPLGDYLGIPFNDAGRLRAGGEHGHPVGGRVDRHGQLRRVAHARLEWGAWPTDGAGRGG